MNPQRSIIPLTAALATALTIALAQDAATPNEGKPKGKAAPQEEGIPVTSALVKEKCGTCHKSDEKGNLTRISYVRATPEGWEEAIKRMVRLNGLVLAPAEAKTILKYLSTNHGLAPEEAKPFFYMAEHRIIDEPVQNETFRGTCTVCHAMGKALQWRRTKDDWKLLANMHVAFYAQADQAFRNGCGANGGCQGGNRQQRGEAAAARPANPVLPIDTTIDFLSKDYGLHSAAWSAWQPRMRAPKLAGKWLVSAHVVGFGNYTGELTVGPGPSEDEFTTRVRLVSLNDGSKVERTGTGLVYAGFSWRGRSKGTTAPAANALPTDISREMREAVWFSPDQSYGEGRWFWGEYQEFGFDIKLRRVTNDPVLSAISKVSIKSGSSAVRVRMIGDNFPADAVVADFDFGPGVTVKSLVSKSSTELTVDVDVAANATSGKRDVAFRRSILQGALAIYDRVDFIKIAPDTALARLGSDVHPKGFQQFEAIGYQRGPDGKPNTADDVELGVIDVNWTVEEYMAVYGDDDKEFVGSLSATGFFTPASDGPNPARKHSRNNYGDVWVVATAKTEKDASGSPLVAKSYLVVTVPSYIRWDQPGVAP
jgi:quinohemoprotein amine dehydrogenase